jgi:hypothetical protein
MVPYEAHIHALVYAHCVSAHSRAALTNIVIAHITSTHILALL